MSEQSVLRSPHVVAKELDISPATLRRWSDEFKDFLSEDATAASGRSHRRYKESDLATLFVVKELMNDGKTYEQVRDKLESYPTVTVASEDHLPGDVDASLFDEDDDDDDAALVAPNGAESPALAFLTNTLATLSDSQKSILNSQAANRELLGVLLQDNFNLKEENNRLRERILEVEREVAQTRQDEEWRREALRQELEAKINASSQMANHALSLVNAIEIPEVKPAENKSGCLGMLFGGGPPQHVVTTPRRSKNTPSPKKSLTRPNPQQPPPSHPKPLFPPE